MVDAQRNTCIASSWMCRLPEPQSSLDAFLGHHCRSSSNICSIICHIGLITKCSDISYYDPGVHFSASTFAPAPLPSDHETPSGFPSIPPPGNMDCKEGNGEVIPNPTVPTCGRVSSTTSTDMSEVKCYLLLMCSPLG